jgi:SAM-dependent methyltransferase
MRGARSSEGLREHLDIWRRKPILRAIYDDFYDRIIDACTPGPTIEIGSGIGNLKSRFPDVVATDIQYARWIDCVADAQRLPFAAATAANFVMVDTLHHLEFPALFFREAERVLRPGGRIVMIEPAITWGSTLFYRLLHHEPVRIAADPLIEGAPDPRRDPYRSNQAVATLLATRDRTRFERSFKKLKIVRVDWFALAAYPLSGGFRPWRLIPRGLVAPMLRLERAIEKHFGQIAGFRMMLVVEKRTD